MPPLLVGVATAVAAEVSTAVLLYGGPGFTRSLTLTLVIQALAFGAGLRTRSPEPGRGLRRRWILSLAAYLGATTFATLWMIFPAIGTSRLGQGLGLAALAALPLHACGSLLAGLAVDASRSRRADPGVELRDLEADAGADGRGPLVASTASFGAALGFVGTGLLLPRAPMPASLLVACLVLLSLGAMIHTSEMARRGGGSPREDAGTANDPVSPEDAWTGEPAERDARDARDERDARNDADRAGPSFPDEAGFTRVGEDPPTS